MKYMRMVDGRIKATKDFTLRDGRQIKKDTLTEHYEKTKMATITWTGFSPH